METMRNTIVVIGSVTAKDYAPVRAQLLRRGVKPRVERVNLKDLTGSAKRVEVTEEGAEMLLLDSGQDHRVKQAKEATIELTDMITSGMISEWLIAAFPHIQSEGYALVLNSADFFGEKYENDSYLALRGAWQMPIVDISEYDPEAELTAVYGYRS